MLESVLILSAVHLLMVMCRFNEAKDMHSIQLCTKLVSLFWS